MLADAAAIAEGKLYVQGGGWDSVMASQMPLIYPALGLVLTFKIDWHEANEDLKILIEFVNEDGKNAGVRFELLLRVSPGPTAKKGSDLYQSAAQMFYGLRFENYGTYRFQVSQGAKVLTTVPLNIHAPPHGMMAA